MDKALALLPVAGKLAMKFMSDRNMLTGELNLAAGILKRGCWVVHSAQNSGMEPMIDGYCAALEELASKVETALNNQRAKDARELNASAAQGLIGSDLAPLQYWVQQVREEEQLLTRNPQYTVRPTPGNRVYITSIDKFGYVLQYTPLDHECTYKVKLDDSKEDWFSAGVVQRASNEVPAKAPEGDHPPPNMEKGTNDFEQAWGSGIYIVTHSHGARVSLSEEPQSREMQRVSFGSEVEVSEVKKIGSRLRGRTPHGWVSLKDEESSSIWLMKRDDSDLSYAWGDEVFGPLLVTKSTGPQPTRNALTGTSRVALLFTASWCPPCRQFTPRLAAAVQKLQAPDLTVVYVPMESDDQAITACFSRMPWLMLSRKCTCGSTQGQCKEQCASKVGSRLVARYRVQGIPDMVILHGLTGSVVSRQGRDDIVSRNFDLMECLKHWGVDNDICQLSSEKFIKMPSPVDECRSMPEPTPPKRMPPRPQIKPRLEPRQDFNAGSITKIFSTTLKSVVEAKIIEFDNATREVKCEYGWAHPQGPLTKWVSMGDLLPDAVPAEAYTTGVRLRVLGEADLVVAACRKSDLGVNSAVEIAVGKVVRVLEMDPDDATVHVQVNIGVHVWLPLKVFVPVLQPQVQVRLVGLTGKAHLNDSVGTLDSLQGKRWQVKLNDDNSNRLLSVQEQNLELLDEAVISKQIETPAKLQFCADNPRFKDMCGLYSHCSESINGHSIWKKCVGKDMVLYCLPSGRRWAVARSLEALQGDQENLIVSKDHGGGMMPSAVPGWGIIAGGEFQAIPNMQFKERYKLDSSCESPKTAQDSELYERVAARRRREAEEIRAVMMMQAMGENECNQM